jgi:hypothetical protein
MPAYTKPPSQWLAQQLAAIKGTAAAASAPGTQYVIECPRRKAGDKEPEHKRGVSVAITGNLAFDHKGNSTGLTGWGQAVWNGTKWVKVE